MAGRDRPAAPPPTLDGRSWRRRETTDAAGVAVRTWTTTATVATPGGPVLAELAAWEWDDGDATAAAWRVALGPFVTDGTGYTTAAAARVAAVRELAAMMTWPDMDTRTGGA